MFVGHPRLIVIDVAGNGQRLLVTTIETKHLLGADVIGGRLEVHDKALRKQGRALDLGLRLVIDEDVSEGRRCIADIRRLGEAVKNFPDQPVDGARVFFVGSVDGCAVSLIVEKQHRHVSNDGSALVEPACVVRFNPLL